MIKYIPMIAAAALLIAAVITVILLVREIRRRREEQRQHSETKRQLGDEIAALESKLEVEQRLNARHTSVLELIGQVHKQQEGRTEIFAFDKVRGRQIFGDDGDSDVTRQREVPLKMILDEALESGELDDNNDGREFAISESENELAKVYLLADITDTKRVPLLEAERDEAQKKLLQSDVLTEALNPEGFGDYVKRNHTDGTRIVFLKTSAATLGDAYREKFTKAVAALLRELTDGGVIGRFSDQSFCFVKEMQNESELRALCDNILCRINNLHTELQTVNACEMGKSVIYISPVTADVAQLLDVLDIKSREAKLNGHYGVHLFDTEETAKLLERRDELEAVINKKQIRFLYRPIATSEDARIYGYELIPTFPASPYETADDALREARLFDKAERLERLIFFEGMRIFDKAVLDGKLLYGTYAWISALDGTFLTEADTAELHEKYYDELKNLIVEIGEELPDKLCTASIKRNRAERLGGAAAVKCGASAEENLLKLMLIKPELVRVSAALVCDAKNKTVIKELKAKLRRNGGKLLVDNINKAAELEAAIAVGAEYLEGEYIGKTDTDPGEIAEKCMTKIGQLQFGK